MTYKQQCIEAMKEYLGEQKLDKFTFEIAIECFISGIDYGSLSGSTDEIKEQVVKNLKPVKDKRAAEIIEKIRNIIK
jgi:hypothetical protein